MAFLGRGRTTGGRRGKRNGGGRKERRKRKRNGSGRNGKDEREIERDGRDGARARRNEGARLVTIDRGVGLFMGVPMRTICSKRLVVLNVYTSRAPTDVRGPVGTTKSPIVSHAASTLRSGETVGHRSLIFRQTPVEGRGRGEGGETVSQRRLTCRHGYSGTTNFVSSELHAPRAPTEILVAVS